jgi:hypothetical protein
MSLVAPTAEAQHKKTRKKTKAATHKKAAAKKHGVAAGRMKKSGTSSGKTTAALSDTTSPRVVMVTSAFKPSLKNAAKVNFTAASPVIDSSRVPVVYNIPAQNLLFSYQPVPIKPLALAPDSGLVWINDHYVKVGAGNFSTALAEGAFSFGDGKKSITNLRANFLTTKGNLPAQQFDKFGMNVISILNTNHNNEWTTKAFYENSSRYFYGYEPASLNYKKDSLLQRFNTAGIEVGLQNKARNDFKITYHPQLQLRYFSDNRDGKEYALLAKARINKGFAKIYAFDLGLTADISKTTFPLAPSDISLKNNLYYVSPTLQFNTPNIKLYLGIQPTWDNQHFTTLPNITAEARIKESSLVAELGWTGYYNKNTYYSLTGFNPWIAKLSDLQNTKAIETYAGIKGAAGNHFTYKARLSFIKLNNQPLFVNDLLDGKTFNVLYEPNMQLMKLHGEIGYNVQEKFSFLAGATFSKYSSQSLYDQAWGLLPFEVTGTVRWKVLKDLQLKADVYLWDGPYYRSKSIPSKTLKLDPAADLNMGIEFAVMPKLNLWFQVNNLLNNKYQRWNQYQVLGLNVLGGVVYSFR